MDRLPYSPAAKSAAKLSSLTLPNDTIFNIDAREDGSAPVAGRWLGKVMTMHGSKIFSTLQRRLEGTFYHTRGNPYRWSTSK